MIKYIQKLRKGKVLKNESIRKNSNLKEDIIYLSYYDMKDKVFLKELLNKGYVGITETGIAVKELTEDDKPIETLINELEV